jgi:hypothetical protein
VDVRTARELTVNQSPTVAFQGQTPGVSKGFVLQRTQYERWLSGGSTPACVMPFLGGEELLKKIQIDRWVIDIPQDDAVEANALYPKVMAQLRRDVLPLREAAAVKEHLRNTEILAENPEARPNRHHAAFLERWWKLGYRREEMLAAIAKRDRYIATSRVASEKRASVFDFIESTVRPADSLTVFALDDDYSFGILSSSLHRQWLEARCSTLETRLRYTSTTVWDTFPWPQAPSADQVAEIAATVDELLQLRESYRQQGVCLATQYNALREPGKSRLRDLHALLDHAVYRAYDFSEDDDALAQLLALNQDIAAEPQMARGPGCAALDGATVSTYRLSGGTE